MSEKKRTPSHGSSVDLQRRELFKQSGALGAMSLVGALGPALAATPASGILAIPSRLPCQ